MAPENAADTTSDIADEPGVNWGTPPFPSEAIQNSIADRFLAVAADSPTAVALRSPAGQWTYEEMGRASGGVAVAIADRQGSEATPVAVLTQHDGPQVLAIFGVIIAGAVVIVLDPLAPAEQTNEVLRASRARLVIHDEANRERAEALAADHDLDLIHLDQTSPATPVAVPRRPGDPVMLAFTSGTGGVSKAAVITHGVIMNLVRGVTDVLGLSAADCMPMLFPTSLAVASYPMFLPLLNGGTLSTLDVRTVGLEPVADFLIDEKVSVAYMAPTVVRFLVDALAGRTFPDLRLVALGGELVDHEVARLTVELFGPDHLANGFGTTETGIIALNVMAADTVVASPEPVPAGRPVTDVELYILDDTGSPVATDRAGEVAVASGHLFAGYWGHPELSEQVLLPDPGRRPGWSMYRTGDLGRLSSDGALTVLGRMDTKVKVRGRFVVVSDVEADIRDLDGVTDASVVPVIIDGVTQLTAVVAIGSDAGPTEVELRSALLERRESFRVPSRWVTVDDLPRLPNGKLDRHGVARAAGIDPDTAPDAEHPARDADVRPSQTQSPNSDATAPTTLRVVRDLWERLLPIAVVDVDVDFVTLGGDSLLAAQMLVLLEKETGVIVPMGDLVHARTARDLAEVVEARKADTTAPSTVARVQSGDDSLPRLWFVHDLQGSAYRVRHLAAALGSDQPVWSFESPLLRGERNQFRSLESFAAAYVRDLLEAQPEGPYWLAGYSFGGVCAYEMARQLVRDGHEVAFVGVVDVGPGYRGPGWGNDRSPLRPWFGVEKPPRPGTGLAGSIKHYRTMVQRNPLGAARHAMVRSGVARLVDPLRFERDLDQHDRVRPEWRLWYAWEQHWQLASRHWKRTNPYAGPIHLFWADESPSADSTMGWSPLVDEVHVHRFPGDHLGALEPSGAKSLGVVLREVLDSLQ